ISRRAQVKRLATGESTGSGRRFVAREETWIGIVPVGYADGFRRDMTGTDVIVDGERRRVGGTGSREGVAGGYLRGTIRPSQTRSTTRSSRASTPGRFGQGGRWSMLEQAQKVLGGKEAWVVGGAVRDEGRGRAVVGRE